MSLALGEMGNHIWAPVGHIRRAVIHNGGRSKKGTGASGELSFWAGSRSPWFQRVFIAPRVSQKRWISFSNQARPAVAHTADGDEWLMRCGRCGSSFIGRILNKHCQQFQVNTPINNLRMINIKFPAYAYILYRNPIILFGLKFQTNITVHKPYTVCFIVIEEVYIYVILEAQNIKYYR